jgi:hypothetical protein
MSTASTACLSGVMGSRSFHMMFRLSSKSGAAVYGQPLVSAAIVRERRRSPTAAQRRSADTLVVECSQHRSIVYS